MDSHLTQALTNWRRHLHAHPELALREAETAAFVCARLDELGIAYEPNVGGHGVVATLTRPAGRRAHNHRSVGLRADMDALPIAEATGLPHASRAQGVMHACGHDGHTTSLLGAAALLARDETWTGTVRFIFQPAEEGGGGARSMLADGLLRRFPIDRIFGYHNWPGLDAGTVAIHSGPVMAGGNRVHIVLDGHPGHAALPHLTRDPMLAAGHLLVALQSIVARNIDPLQAAVISICTVEGGSALNQIPTRVALRGTSRFFTPAVRDQLKDAIERVSQGIAATFGVTATVSIPAGMEATVNHAEDVELAADACARAGIALRRDLPPAMTGEDFSWYLKERPGAFVWIGNGSTDGGRELHNDRYDFNDDILPVAATYLAEVARRALAD